MRCQANTQRGQPCGRQAMGGAELCHAHRGVGVGRPSSLTDEVERKLCDALRAGNHLEVAARYAGVSRSTLHRWLALADQQQPADPRLEQFREAVEKAQADAEVHAVGVVRRAIAQGEWRAALAYLERRHPQRWRRREQVQPEARDRQLDHVGDLDAADPKTRALLDALLKHRQTDR
jgi:transposase